jgi:hypothetical protein
MAEDKENDYCGYCGKSGPDTWKVSNAENDPFFYTHDCDCEEHAECSNCGQPI